MTNKDLCEKALSAADKYGKKSGNNKRWHLVASALDNAGDTANEKHFEHDSEAYWDMWLASLEGLLTDRSVSDADRAFFAKLGIRG